MSQKQEENPAEETGEEKQVRIRGTGVAARAGSAPAAADWPPLPQAPQGLATVSVAQAAFRRGLVPRCRLVKSIVILCDPLSYWPLSLPFSLEKLFYNRLSSGVGGCLER